MADATNAIWVISLKFTNTWWPYYRNARARNLGWRLDYIFVSKQLENGLKNARIQNGISGSDHCPVQIELK